VKHFGPAILSDAGIVGARGKHVATDKTGWYNHMSAKRVAWKLGPLTWLRYRKIASIRNPFDKAVSWFWFWAGKDNKDVTAGRDPVEEFRAFLRDQEANGRFRSRQDPDWRVTHILGRPVIDHYIRLEHLQGDFAALLAELGISGVTLEVPKTKTKSRKADPRDVPEYFDEKTADILRRNQGWIFEAGGYSLDPADAGRGSRGGEGQETAAVAPDARGPTPSAGVGPAVKSTLTRRAG